MESLLSTMLAAVWAWFVVGIVARLWKEFSNKEGWFEVIAEAFCLIGSFGYLIFWAFVAFNYLGFLAQGLFYFFICYLLYKRFYKKYGKNWRLLLFFDLRENSGFLSFLLCLITALLYIAIFHLYEQREGSYLTQAAIRFLNLPADNILPKLLSDKLRSGEAPKILFIDWLSSDRPPLLTGLHLLFSINSSEHVYQGIAVFFQCLNIFSVFYFSYRLSISDKTALQIIVILLVFCGFSLVNSLFVWPKMQASGFFLIAIAKILPEFATIKRRCSYDIVFSGVAMGLAFLSHAGVFFSFPVLLVLVLSAKFKGKEKLKILIQSSFFALPFLISWKLYSIFIAPPGDRLLKWHLAGQQDLTEETFGRLLKKAYSNITFGMWFQNRIENFKAMIGPILWGENGLKQRQLEFFHLGATLFPVFIGIFIILFLYFRKNRLLDMQVKLIQSFFWIFIGIFFSLLFWSVLMYLPYSTVNHQGSYATITLLMFCCAVGVSLFPHWLSKGILILWILRFVYAWLGQPEFAIQKNIILDINFLSLVFSFILLWIWGVIFIHLQKKWVIF